MIHKESLTYLLLAFPLPVAAGGSAWWVHDYEYSYVESVTLILLVCMALVFETIWHKVTHHVQHSYKYGKLHDIAHNSQDNDDHDKHGNIRHVRLAHELVQRTGGEFMTLGFLAFCVFMFNQIGGFAFVAKRYGNDGDHRRLASASGDDVLWHYPATDSDWLHMVEIAHMKLFIGMVFYFSLALVVVNGSSQIIQKWEALRLRRLQDPHRGHDLHSVRHDQELNQYLGWRTYFINRIVEWKERRPDFYLQLLERLDIDDKATDASDRLRRDMEERCAFSSYLALNVEYGVRDTIELHSITWGIVLVLFSLFALMHRYAKLSLLRIMPPFFTFVFLILLIMRGLVIIRQKQVHEWEKDPALENDSREAKSSKEVQIGIVDSKSTRFIQKHNVEMILLRSLQVILFLICYGFSQNIMDIQGWQTHPDEVLLFSLLFALLQALLAYMLPSQVPLFLALASLPPYIDALNFKLLQSSIDDHMPVRSVSFISAKSDLHGRHNHPHGTHAARERSQKTGGEEQDGSSTILNSTASSSSHVYPTQVIDSFQSAQEEFMRIGRQLEKLREFERNTVRTQEARESELRFVKEKMKSLEDNFSTLSAKLDGSMCTLPNAVDS